MPVNRCIYSIHSNGLNASSLINSSHQVPLLEISIIMGSAMDGCLIESRLYANKIILLPRYELHRRD
jgi:hypothetical protein